MLCIPYNTDPYHNVFGLAFIRENERVQKILTEVISVSLLQLHSPSNKGGGTGKSDEKGTGEEKTKLVSSNSAESDV